jgi:hypothetical protein
MRVTSRIPNKMQLAVVLLVLPLSLAGAQQKHATRAQRERAASLPAVMWHDPGNVSKLNMTYGAGGTADAPDPNGKFVFIKEDMHGTNPKFDVRDERGRVWRVKLGPESRPETAATRLLWAAGYYVNEDYFVPSLKIENLPKLRRGRKFVSPDGIVRGARLKLRRKDTRKLGDWDWSHNPFAGTRTLNGLRVMMCLVDNWDLAADNNSVYEVDGERRFLVTDVGASFGRTGNYFARSKDDLNDYVRARFIAGQNSDHVDLVMHTRSFLLTVFDLPAYNERVRMQWVGKDIPVADARWVGRLLAGLTPDQLRDCFRAAGYEPQTAEIYARTVQQRIAELNRL